MRSLSRVCVFQREPWLPCAEGGRQGGSQHRRTKGTGPGRGWACREKEATFVDFPTQRLQGWRKRMRIEQPAPSPGSRRGGREPRHPAGRPGLGRECGVTETHEMAREAGWKESRGGPGPSICGGCPEVKPGRVPDSIPQLRSFLNSLLLPTGPPSARTPTLHSRQDSPHHPGPPCRTGERLLSHSDH